jgi:hypothetical protein
MKFESAVSKLLDRKVVVDGCWVIPGCRNRPKIKVEGKVELASRVMVAESRGLSLADNWLACHTCYNPECINPDHLYAGTKSSNHRDREDKLFGRVH